LNSIESVRTLQPSVKTTRSASRYGSGRTNSVSMALKIVVFAAMPSPSVEMQMSANSGLRLKPSTATRVSFQRSSSHPMGRTSRQRSLTVSTAWRLAPARRAASAGDTP
jgi:hypothetical protein